jgi:hypothetical protein
MEDCSILMLAIYLDVKELLRFNCGRFSELLLLEINCIENRSNENEFKRNKEKLPTNR